MKMATKEFLAKGKRGYVYTTTYKNKIVVLKEKNPTSTVDTLEIEAKFLKILNKKNIGPKFISYESGVLIRDFVDGPRIGEFLEACSKKEALSIITQVLEQCRTMDLLGINKQEMTNPYKHILVSKGKAIMIDFERCRFTQKPKNVTQIIQYICSNRVVMWLSDKGITLDVDKLQFLGMKYKKEGLSEEVFSNIISLI